MSAGSNGEPRQLQRHSTVTRASYSVGFMQTLKIILFSSYGMLLDVLR